MSAPNILELLAANPHLYQALRQNLAHQPEALNQFHHLLSNPNVLRQLQAYQTNALAALQNPQLAASLNQQLRAQASPVPAAANRPAPLGLADLQAAVLKELQSVLAERRGLTLQELGQRLNQNVAENPELIESLQKNAKVQIQDGKYYYVTKYDVRSIAELRQLIAHSGYNPLYLNDLEDLYPTVMDDIRMMTRTGEIIRIKSVDTVLPDVIYWRDTLESNRVRLSGQLLLTKGSRFAQTTVDLTSEIFRNDVVVIQDAYFRVCSASESNRKPAKRLAPGEIDLTGSHATVNSSASPPNVPGAPGVAGSTGLVAANSASAAANSAVVPGGGGAGASVSPIVGFSEPYVSIGNSVKMTGGHYSAADTAPHMLPSHRSYVHAFTATSLPLDNVWTGESGTYTAFRIGCSGDVRLLWRALTVPNLASAVLIQDHQVDSVQATGTSTAANGNTSGANDGVAQSKPEAVAPSDMSESSSGLMTTLSGLLALEKLPSFPSSHTQLRAAMQKVGMNTLMAPGTLEAGKLLPSRTDDKRRVKRAARALDIRSATIKQSHLHGDILREVERTRQQEIRHAIAKAKETH